MGTTQKKIHKSSEKKKYNKFHQIDGRHPLQQECPDAFISYKARKRKGGKVAFFNFDLAKEMGLIPKSHPHEMNEELEQKSSTPFPS
ncbi:hypothetical protein [Bacteriovorax sp. DB6_IX]|uniref:hypothetical protein n=1 Tax=Bacteriovorax sp. DB6_IX TaxID=1353530 RepID=UPI000423DD73|nr:hypothetical protein [Bacteriovorax sp. DB6_IX]